MFARMRNASLVDSSLLKASRGAGVRGERPQPNRFDLVVRVLRMPAGPLVTVE